jgi:type IV secretory pathway protease TraF
MHFPGRSHVLVVYNPSGSVQRGWYRIGYAESLHVGDIVLVPLAAEVSALAEHRGYLPAGIPWSSALAPWGPRACASKVRT